MQSQVQAGTVAGMPQQIPVIPTDNTLYSDTLNTLNPAVAEGLSWINKDQNNIVSQPITQQPNTIQQPTPVPVVAAQQPLQTKQKKKSVPWSTQQPTVVQDISWTPKRIDTTDTSGNVNVKKTWMQQIAEKKWLVKDGNVVSQAQLNKYALQRASDNIKNIATRWEKVDEARLNEIFDTTLSTIWIQPWTPQYMSAVDSIKKSYLDQIKNSWFSSIEQSLESINKKYKEFWQLKNLSSDAIYNSFDSYSPEQKDFIAQNNPAEYQKAKQKYDEQKKTQKMNDMMTWNIKKTTPDDLKKQTETQIQSIWWTKATQDYDSYINTPELLKAEKMLTVNDKEIAKLQVSLEPQNLKKEIMGRYSTALSSSALDALYYDEANDRQQTLQTLLWQKEMALKEYNRVRDENMDRYKVVKQNEDQIVSTLFANGGAWLASSSTADIDQYVKDGYMTEAMGNTLKKQLSGMTLKTMWDYGIVDQATVKKINQMSKQWMSPNSIMMSLMESWQYLPPSKDKFDVIKMWDDSRIQTKNWQIVGQWTLQQISQNTGASPQALQWLAWCSQFPDGSKWWQCAKFVNDYLQKAWMIRVFSWADQSLESKIGKVNSTTPSVWSVMVMWWNTKYGHVGIVQSINPDWTIDIIESNYDGKETVNRRTVDPNKSKVYWYVQVGTSAQQWWSRKLTDKERTQSNQAITSFKSDPQVKAFEEAYSQWANLLSSLSDPSWPWDTAAIFWFMKALDPQSVVRESEFETAARSSWVFNQLWNTFSRLSEWKLLTDSQRVAFWKLAKQFIENKAKIYDTKYNDGIRRLQLQWIPTEYFPTSTAEQMRQYFWWNNQNTVTSWRSRTKY